MVLVDTTVWIDLFAGADSWQVTALGELLQSGGEVCTCGLVLTEVLQGIRTDADYRRTRQRLEALVYLPAGRGEFIRAAELYRQLRSRGVTIRRAADCIIAAVCLRHGAVLLHNDRDFLPLSEHCRLQAVMPGSRP